MPLYYQGSSFCLCTVIKWPNMKDLQHIVAPSSFKFSAKMLSYYDPDEIERARSYVRLEIEVGFEKFSIFPTWLGLYLRNYIM